MFAYCLNNPGLLSDPSGYLGENYAIPCKKGFDDLWATGYGTGGVIIIPGDWETGVIAGIAIAIGEWIEEHKNAVVSKIETSLSKSKHKHNPDTYHNHHIVPQNDLRGLPAYIVLQEVFPDTGVDDPRNIVQVSSRIHARLHSNEYYILVNYVITLAYLSAEGSGASKESAVSVALESLRLFINSLELIN